jgi:hypothetical protein
MSLDFLLLHCLVVDLQMEYYLLLNYQFLLLLFHLQILLVLHFDHNLLLILILHP